MREMSMNSDRIAGAAEQAKGKAETAAGQLTGDTKLRVEGRADEAAGTFRNATGDLEDAVREATADPQSEVEHLRAEVERRSSPAFSPRSDLAAAAAADGGVLGMAAWGPPDLGLLRPCAAGAAAGAALMG